MLDKQSLVELADIYKEKYNRLIKDNAELERQIDEANAEIERLRKERDEARREVCGFHHLTGFLAGDYANSRGWYCFPDRNCKFEPSVYDFKLLLEGQDKIFLERIDRITADRDKAIAERDEARREVCEADTDTHGGALLEAERRGWDCFKENTNG